MKKTVLIVIGLALAALAFALGQVPGKLLMRWVWAVWLADVALAATGIRLYNPLLAGSQRRMEA